MRKWMPVALILAAFAAGMAWGGPDEEGAAEPDLLDLETRLDQVRREVKIISFDTGMQRVPALITREKQYTRLLGEIEDLATHLLEADPASWVAHYALGVARAGQQDMASAQLHFGKAAELNPALPLAKHAEGIAHAQLKQPEAALASFADARRIDEIGRASCRERV